MKKICKAMCGFIAGTVILSASAFAVENATVVVDGVPLSTPGQIIDGRTLVPARDISEALGAIVGWDDATQTVSVQRQIVSIDRATNLPTYEWRTVSMQIGSAQVYVDGMEASLDVPAQIINDKTMVPARAVSQWFDATVTWDESTHVVTITSALNSNVGDARVQQGLTEKNERDAIDTALGGRVELWVSEYNLKMIFRLNEDDGKAGFYSSGEGSLSGLVGSEELVYAMPDVPSDLRQKDYQGTYNGIKTKSVNGQVLFDYDDLKSHGIS